MLKALEAVVKGVLKAPGLVDQAPNSSLTTGLNRDYRFEDPSLLFIGSEFEPSTGTLAKLGDYLKDSILFKGEANDAVAPTRGALGLREGESVVGRSNVLVVDRASEINHHSYYRDRAVVAGALGFLGGVSG